MSNFEYKEEWKIREGNFNIVISRHSVEQGSFREYGDGLNRWCIYVYIYSQHPLFNLMNKPEIDYWGHPIDLIPFHGGCTFHRLHYGENELVNSVQIGCDYNHLHDEGYTTYTNKHVEYFIADAELIINKLNMIQESPEMLKVLS